MYWPTASAKRLHLSPSGLDRPSNFFHFEKDAAEQITESEADTSTSGDGDDELLQLARSRNGLLWAALSPTTLSIWSSRPAQVVAALARTPQSLHDYGNNRRVEWRPDGRALLVETDRSFLLLYNLVYHHASSSIYSYIPPAGTGSKSQSGENLAPGPSSLANSFAPGAGESANAGDMGLGGLSGESCELRFRLVLRIDAGLRWATCTETHMLVSTVEPPAVQCIRWPSDGPDAPPPDPEDPTMRTRTTLVKSLPWIVKSHNTALGSDAQSSECPQVSQIVYSRPMDVFVWLTSDGRAYTANLDLLSSTPWTGKCFHGALAQRRRSSAAQRRAPDVAALKDESEAARKEAKHQQGTPSEGNLTDAVTEIVSYAAPTEVSTQNDTSAKDTAEDEGTPKLQAESVEQTQRPDEQSKGGPPRLAPDQRCTTVSVNAKFSLIAVGLEDGTVAVYNYRAFGRTPIMSHTMSVRHALKSTASYLTTGSVQSLSWTSDGYALAVGWDRGMAVWSTYGKLMCCTLREDWELASKHFSDAFMFGARSLFWGPGNTELFILSLRRPDKPFKPDNQLFVLPFSKSAVAGQHSPDNTRFAFFQTDDSVHVYRGADQPDLSVINPESDVWQHIKIPQRYLAANWPIRYAAISGDGNLIAVAGRRGLAHYSTTSGRWKTHRNIAQEQAFVVRGGLQWFQHVLIAACDAGGECQLRLYSRDADLDSSQLLDLQVLPSPVILTSLFDNSLLVYTADNTFYHFLIDLTPDRIRLRLCGSITFEGVVGEPARVRGMSWMIPESQQRFGDPVDDLTVATIIFLIDGKLVLLRPRKLTGGGGGGGISSSAAADDQNRHPISESAVENGDDDGDDDDEEVAYDMQILADKIEYYWTHLQGIGTLENSLWGYDGSGIRLWLDALRISTPDADAASDRSAADEDDAEEQDDIAPEYKTIESSVSMPLDFYPLCVLLEKGIVLGIEPEASLRKSLDFAIWRTGTNTHLFLHQILRNYLEKRLLEEAVFFAASYQGLLYFAHALEILLHAVLEDEADAGLGDVQYSRKPSGGLLEKERSTSSLLADVAEEDDEEHGGGDGTEASTWLDGTKSANGRRRSNSASSATSMASSRGTPRAILPLVIEFLDHFPEALEVVVGCARKTEVARWAYLFDVVGAPLSLFQKCIQADQLRTAGMYLLVLHNLEPLDVSIAHTIRLLRLAVEKQDWSICRDLLRFVASIDPSGDALRIAVQESGILAPPPSQSQAQDPAHSLLQPPSSSSSSSLSPTAPPMLRTSSAPGSIPVSPARLDTMVEEDEDDSSSSTATSTAVASKSTLESHTNITPSRLSLPGRSKSSTLPSYSSTTSTERYTAPASSTATPTSNWNSVASRSPGLAAVGIGNPPKREFGHGFGMSLSRVGLRNSHERIWDAKATAPVSPSSTSPRPSSSSSRDLA
ncbi:RIC1-domain-containing protein [Testicularia cyperi]|uniref:RIC1-domain-containing protein n=1 Tax=Testicularia cyperi TaxID=1882483 RepID=A0A317XSG3_9BASI|nr:RIC1-domain-containing protein [Testicularia cyperi]